MAQKHNCRLGMDIKNTTIVTAIFDIGRDEWDNFTMSYHTYLMWMRNILFLDTNMVIYTEEKFKKQIIDFRKEVDPTLEKTIIVIEPLENIIGYKKFFNPLNTLMSSESFKSKIQFQVPEMTKPLYNVVMFAKLFYILDAHKRNLFNSDLFVWADAGVLRNDKPELGISWPDTQKINELDNNKVTFFCHHPYVRVGEDHYEQHALSQMRYIQGGSIFVPKKCVDEVCEIFEDVVKESVESGYVGSDEKMFDFLYLRDPNKYNLIQCGWREYIDLFTSDKDLKVVVSRYNEDTSWTNKLNYESVIFNKNESDNHLYENNLPNVGRETHTFMSYIIDNYDNLPNYVAFVQGNPFDHCNDVINDINGFDFKSEFLPLGRVNRYNMEYESIDDQMRSFGETMGINITFPSYNVPGAQHIISRRLIRKHPIEFYKKIHSLVNTELYPFSCLDFEKTLFQIYGIYNV